MCGVGLRDVGVPGSSALGSRVLRETSPLGREMVLLVFAASLQHARAGAAFGVTR